MQLNTSKNPRLSIATLPYQLKGSNKSLITCRAASPYDAVDIFLATFPNQEMYEIKRLGCSEDKPEFCFQVGETVVTRAGEHLVICDRRIIHEIPHSETNLEMGAWFPEHELRIAQVMEVVAA